MSLNGNLLNLAVNSDVILWLNLLHLAVKWLHIGLGASIVSEQSITVHHCFMGKVLRSKYDVILGLYHNSSRIEKQLDNNSWTFKQHVQVTTTLMCILLHSAGQTPLLSPNTNHMPAAKTLVAFCCDRHGAHFNCVAFCGIEQGVYM